MWADASLLNNLKEGGAVVAIIAVVILFLKKQEKSDQNIKDMVNSFQVEMAASHRDFREHVTGIMNQGLTAHRETRDAIRALESTIAGVKKEESGRSHES